jgi:hypothetical protein
MAIKYFFFLTTIYSFLLDETIKILAVMTENSADRTIIFDY